MTISLDTTVKATKQVISLFSRSGVEAGTHTLKVTSSGKPVELDGVGVSRH